MKAFLILFFFVGIAFAQSTITVVTNTGDNVINVVKALADMGELSPVSTSGNIVVTDIKGNCNEATDSIKNIIPDSNNVACI